MLSLTRTWAVMAKEFVQLTRDRLTYAMILALPIVQLLLFGYAINADPRNLPTAVLVQDNQENLEIKMLVRNPVQMEVILILELLVVVLVVSPIISWRKVVVEVEKVVVFLERLVDQLVVVDMALIIHQLAHNQVQIPVPLQLITETEVVPL